MALFAAPPASAEETVRLRSGSDGRGVVEVVGTVVDFTGREIRLARAGREQAYPTQRVIEVVTQWPPGYDEGKAALAEGKYAEAVQQFARAAQAEQRVWVRRLAMEQMIAGYAAQEDWLRSGDLLVSLASSDPATPALGRPPLPWARVEGVPQPRAENWLRDNTEAAQLLGASHLLPGALRGEATKVLQALARSEDPRIALLAQAQLWRTEVVTVGLSQVAKWEETLRKASAPAGGGPWLAVGDAYRQKGEHDRAMLAYLHSAIDFPHDIPSAARGLSLAAQVARDAGQTEEERKLLRQLARDYPNTPPAIAARSMLQSGPTSEAGGPESGATELRFDTPR
jgi:tetratricopeptide (TPR) repeat protein